MKYRNIINAACRNVWFMLPDKMDAICQFLTIKANGGDVAQDMIDAAIAQQPTSTVSRSGSIAVLPLHGVISERMGSLTEFSGGTSMEAFGKEFDNVANDPNIGAIVIDVNSPGGSAAGCRELSGKIYNARKEGRPIYAVANSLAASAAYYIGSAADKFYATPSGEGGSVGVVAIHTDTTEADAKEGIKYNIRRIPEHKYEGSSYEPLSEDAQNYIDYQLSVFYDMFISDVARNRGTQKEVVHENYGKGRTLLTSDAIVAGMFDGMATLDDVIGFAAKAIKPANNNMTGYRAGIECDLL